MNYHSNQQQKNEIKLRQSLERLPAFIEDFFRGIGETTAIRTRLAYSYDIRDFFAFLVTYIDGFSGQKINDFTIEVLEKISISDIERYQEYLSNPGLYDVETIPERNERSTISRKLSALRAMYRYFNRKRQIQSNPLLFIDVPKLHKKAIVKFEPDEVALLLDEVESGEHLSPRQKKFHEYTKHRDLALLTLLLGTGIRVSECVGLDMKDIDFKVNGIRIIRKGGKEAVVYFGTEVENALRRYLEDRVKKSPLEGHEEALFLSLHNRRLSIRSVQVLVKKYSMLVTNLKDISPHKLRSTFGTNLYKESGDIYLVADVLGHSSVETTRKHYAEMDDERRRQVARMVHLRE